MRAALVGAIVLVVAAWAVTVRNVVKLGRLAERGRDV